MADVVHQHIDPAEPVQHRSRQFGDLGSIADIGDDRQRRTTRRGDLVDGPSRQLGIDIGDDHRGAMTGEQVRGRRADTATAAGHHRDPVGQQRTGLS